MIFLKVNVLRSGRQEVFCKTGVFKNFAKFTRKHLRQSLRPATLLNKRFWHRCFPLNFAKLWRNTFFIEHLWWLLLAFLRQASKHLHFFTKNSLQSTVQHSKQIWLFWIGRPNCITNEIFQFINDLRAINNRGQFQKSY